MNGKSYNVALVYALFVLNGVASGVGDILLYRWAKTAQPWWLWLALFVWLSTLLLFGYLLRLEHFSFGAAVLLATLIHLGVSLCWSWFFTAYELSGWEKAGILLALVAVMMLELGRSTSAAR